jgi:copper chaperone
VNWAQLNTAGLDLPKVGSPIFLVSGESCLEHEFTMITLHIPNMNCGGCARGVTAEIREVDASAQVDPDLQGRTVAVQSTKLEARLRQVLADAGFAPT